MCFTQVILDDTDIFETYRAEGDCGWKGPDREDTHEGARQADLDADNHESSCAK